MDRRQATREWANGSWWTMVGGRGTRTGRVLLAGWILASGACVDDLTVLATPDVPESPSGLISPVLLYRFNEGVGDLVLDSSELPPLVHLRIEEPTSVTWGTNALTGDGVLTLDSPVRLSSDGPAEKVFDACVTTEAITVEAWIEPAEVVVDGTKRILTMSASVSERNFLLGQGGLFANMDTDGFGHRVRTTDTGENGLPMFLTPNGAGAALGGLLHVIATRSDDETEAIYVNGERAMVGERTGRFRNWDPSLFIAIGDEFGTNDSRRAWLGTLHQVAVYSTFFDQTRVDAHFAAGSDPAY